MRIRYVMIFIDHYAMCKSYKKELQKLFYSVISQIKAGIYRMVRVVIAGSYFRFVYWKYNIF